MDADNRKTQEEAAALEEKTRDQAKSREWFSARKFRLTASRFGEICKATAAKDVPSLCASLTTTSNIQTRAILHGKTYEKTAIAEFEKKTNESVLPCGFFVDPSFPFLGASPDGKVGEEALVEVKCPFSAREKKIEVCPEIPYLEEADGDLRLKKNHNYYYQVQGQLAITKRKFCYFVVYTFQDLFVEKIEYDSDFFQTELVPKLTEFFKMHYRPFVASKM